jgi:hypothetical protein
MREELLENENLEEIIKRIRAEIERLRERVIDAEEKFTSTGEDDETRREAIIHEITNILAHHLVMLQLSYASLSTGRRQVYRCQMPNQPSHGHYDIYTCTTNITHKFCRSHDLVNCPIPNCGGTLL